jgi:hypothetical protein
MGNVASVELLPSENQDSALRWAEAKSPSLRKERERLGHPPIRCVFGGRTQLVEMTIGVKLLPPPVAGSRMFEGELTVVVPLFHGVFPAAQVKAVVPLMLRASITAPAAGYAGFGGAAVKML